MRRIVAAIAAIRYRSSGKNDRGSLSMQTSTTGMACWTSRSRWRACSLRTRMEPERTADRQRSESAECVSRGEWLLSRVACVLPLVDKVSDSVAEWGPMKFVMIASLVLLAMLPASAQAQRGFMGVGSTAQGDYLRGVGIAGMGMGL